MLRPEELDQLVQRIAERLRPQRVLLFGSYAKGRATIRSDLDLLVIMETQLPMTHRGDAALSILASSVIPIDLHVCTPEEVEAYGTEPGSFIHSVLSTGKVVYRRSDLP